MATAELLITAEEFGELPSEPKSELVRGRIVEVNMPYPRHGAVCATIVTILNSFVRAHKLGRVIGNDSGVITERGPDTVRGADVAFYSYDRLPAGPLPRKYLNVVPDLVFEVRSPSDRWGKLMRKVAEYLEAGVRIVCVVEAEQEQIHVHDADGSSRTLGLDDTLEFPTILPGFQCQVRELIDSDT